MSWNAKVRTGLKGPVGRVLNDQDCPLIATGQTNSAAGENATIKNAPTKGDPSFWLKVAINGQNYAIPCWKDESHQPH